MLPCRQGITRISLVGDAFASSVRRPVGEGQSDISVQSEPTRRRYLCLGADGFRVRRCRFFAISRKGFTYKFRCTLTQTDAQADFCREPGDGQWRRRQVRSASLGSRPILLMKAMAARLPLTGYVVTNPNTKPAQVGTLQVVSQAIYDGPIWSESAADQPMSDPKTPTSAEGDLSPPMRCSRR